MCSLKSGYQISGISGHVRTICPCMSGVNPFMEAHGLLTTHIPSLIFAGRSKVVVIMFIVWCIYAYMISHICIYIYICTYMSDMPVYYDVYYICIMLGTTCITTPARLTSPDWTRPRSRRTADKSARAGLRATQIVHYEQIAGRKQCLLHGFVKCPQTLRGSQAPKHRVSQRNSIASRKTKITLAPAMYS